MKFDKHDVYLMNSELCAPIGEFKAKIIIMCPDQDTMDEMKKFLKKRDRVIKVKIGPDIVREKMGRMPNRQARGTY